METKLKPCPFCGKLPEIWPEEEDAPGGPTIIDYYADCRCGARLYGYSQDEKVVIKKWNTRIKI